MEGILLFTKRRTSAALLLGSLPFRQNQRKEVGKPVEANMQIALFNRSDRVNVDRTFPERSLADRFDRLNGNYSNSWINCNPFSKRY